MTTTTRELRFSRLPPAIRSTDGSPVLRGYGAVYDSLSRNLGGFVEEIDPGAFTETLRRIDERNVLGAVNHDPSWLIGTTDSGTLRVASDDTGLAYEMTLDLDDPDAVRLARKVETGKMRGSSFSFATHDDEWSTTAQGFPLRRLLAVELYELGPVASPAYLGTEVDGMSVALRSLAEFIDEPLDRVVEAAKSNDLKKLVTRVAGIAEDPEPETPSAPPAAGSDQRLGRRNPPTR